MRFYESNNPQGNFVISFQADPKGEFCRFAKGYKDAADEIAGELLSRARFPDFEAYPVVFLYRHSFELYLKGILITYSRICAFKDLEDENWIRNSHRLAPLAKSCETVAQRVHHGDPDIQRLMNEALRIAQDFDIIDPISFSYRYPINTGGQTSTARHQVLNLRELHANLTGLLNDLDTMCFGLEVELDDEIEMYEFFQDVMDELRSST